VITERAPAKLNLALEVLGRRPDGYHDLATVFQTVDLCDDLTFERVERADQLSLHGDLATPDNLILRAARALHPNNAARITLSKRIPIAAGLGGGSSDAAATLRALSRLWRTQAALPPLAASLGADIPFLLLGGTAFATGIGHLLERLPDPPTRWTILYTPFDAPPDKTTRAYRALLPSAYSDGTATRVIAAALRRGEWPDLSHAPNAFESVADELFPGLVAARRRLSQAGAPWARLTGAGPTLFSLVEDRGTAAAILARLSAPERSWIAATLPATLRNG